MQKAVGIAAQEYDLYLVLLGDFVRTFITAWKAARLDLDLDLANPRKS